MPTPNWITYKESTHGINGEGHDDVFNRPNRTIWANFTAEHNKNGSHISTLTAARWKHEVYTYTGTGVDGLTITLQTTMNPHLVRIWSEETAYSVMRQDDMPTDISVVSDGTKSDNMITALALNSFTLGTHAAVNTNGATYFYLAIGEYQAPVYTEWDEVADTLVESGKSFKWGYDIVVYDNAIHAGFDYDGVNPAGIAKWTGTAWQYLGTPSGERNCAALVVNTDLFIGTGANAKLFTWDGASLTEVAPNLADTDIYDLVLFGGKVYGSSYSGGGGGKLLEWNGTNAWVEKAPRYGSINYLELCVFNGELYAGGDSSGELLKWNGTNAWTKVADKLSAEVGTWTMCVFNNKLYAGTNPNGKLYEFTGTAWTEKAPKLGSETRIVSLCVHYDNLYAGTYPGGKLYRWNNVDAWVEQCGTLGGETSVEHLLSWNGDLYGITSPNGKLYKAV